MLLLYGLFILKLNLLNKDIKIKNIVAFEKDYLNGKSLSFFSIKETNLETNIKRINDVFPLHLWTYFQYENDNSSKPILISDFIQNSDVSGYILTPLTFEENEEVVINNFDMIKVF